MKPVWVHASTPDYKGRRIHGPPGVQEAAVASLLRHTDERGAVLDLATGSGAMLLRLSEVGFGPLEAVARMPGVFGELGERAGDGEEVFHQIDLNEDFAERFPRRFDVIVSSEAIEHLRSPRHFIEQATRLLEPGGHLLLTTPHFANAIGRIRFLLFGELRWFDRRLARSIGHISPVTDVQMRMLLEDAGLELVEATSGGSFSGWLRRLVTALVALPLVLGAGRGVLDDCNIYLARKPE